MCGICGAIDLTGAGEAGALVQRMTPTMRHRGPDDEGYLGDDSLALGMRRLSVIDLDGGHQPIFNEDGTVGVVLNGEIYNFQKLQKQLEAKGHKFRTRADSEVIAHAYEEWGEDCVQHLEGMFAFAVYDQQRAKAEGQRAKGKGQRAGEDARGPSEGGPRLFLARDRLGIKPLYYYESKVQRPRGKVQSPTSKVQRPDGDTDFGLWTLDFGLFLFASEVRTLLASGAVPRKLSRAALESYLLFGSVSEPMTLVEGVLSLPPGHTLTIDLGKPGPAIEPQPQTGKGAVQSPTSNVQCPQPFWNLASHAQRNGHAGDTASAVTRVRELLEESIRLHLIADVPVGVFLSGGIDSTTVAALASREASRVHTFTVAFNEREFSEAGIARRTAATLGTSHEELLLGSDEMLSRLPEAVGALDQPSIDGVNTYFVSWAAREAGLKVVLSGLGGDELFGGYRSTFLWTPRYERLAKLSAHTPAPLRSAVAAAVAGAGARTARPDAARRLAALWNGSSSLPHPYFFARALFTPGQVSDLTRIPGESAAPWRNWLQESSEQVRNLDSFAAVSCLEARSYLVSTLLRDTDSMSMAHSLEVRVPFLHHRLFEFVAGLPRETKLRDGAPKALLVESMKDLLPAEVVAQTKRGFTFPWQEWLRGPLRPQVEAGLLSLAEPLSELLDEQKVAGIWESYLEGKTSWSRPWSLYVLNEWVKRNLK